MEMRLYYNGGKHMIMHEYHTYETYSFIADIGGYLGLLLGQSLFGSHLLLTKWCRDKWQNTKPLIKI